jgi:GH35 family endo-1,4-beta-xylanase
MPKRFAWQWDVANEYFLDADPSGINPNDFWVANLGPKIIPQAFKRAYEVYTHCVQLGNCSTNHFGGGYRWGM